MIDENLQAADAPGASIEQDAAQPHSEKTANASGPAELSEIEQLRAQVRQLQQERDLAYEMLRGLEYFGPQVSFWDGTPQRLPGLVKHIQRAFAYPKIALSLFQAGSLHPHVVIPNNAQFNLKAPADKLEEAIVRNNALTLSSKDEHVLIVPLVTGMQRVGMLEIGAKTAFTPPWIDFWNTLAPQIASLIVGGQLLDQLESARHRHQLLYEITRQLTSGVNLDKVLSDILLLTIPYTGAGDGSVILLNDRTQVISHTIVRRQTVIPNHHKALGNVLESGLARWVIENKQAAIVFDTTMDERWVHLPDDSLQIRSALAVPLQRGDQVRGLLVLVHHEPNHFTQDHLAFLSSVADQAAIAVENVFLLEQTQQRVVELRLLNEISEATSSLHLDDILCIVAERTAQALQVKRCAIFLLDETGVQLVLRAVSHPDMTAGNLNLVVPLAHSPHIAEAMQIRQPVQIPDIFADERLSFFWEEAQELDIKAQLAIPLITKQRVIGAISLDRRSALSTFTKNEVDLCRTIAHQAANAIENARLYAELHQRAERLSLVNNVSHDIGALLDIDQLLWEVVRLIRETLDCYHVSIGLIEEDRLVFRSSINYLYQSVEQRSLSLEGEGEGIAGWVARHGRSLLVPDVHKDPRYVTEENLPNTRCQLAVPLKVQTRTNGIRQGQDSVIGALHAESTEVNAFTTDDLGLLEALAAQISVAVESARLFGQVREEQATLEAVMNGSGDAIIVTDTEDRILFVNPAAQKAFGEEKAIEPTSPFTEVISNKALLALWRKPIKTDVHSFSGEIPMPDGRTFYANMSLVERVGRVIMMQDITYLKELDQMKSSFVSTVSHDLRSPLQGIQTSAELLPKMGELTQEQQKEIEHILAVVRRIANLVQHLLDIGRIEAGVGMEIEPCPLNEILARSTSALRSRAQRKGIDLTIELPKVLPMVKGNAMRLEQVFDNLVNNAIKFTPQGSVAVSAWEQGDTVTVEVRDTGVGIPPEAQEKLFQKFYRVKTPETQGIEGTGLGLAIVKSIVESYDGQIVCTSAPRLGSTFTVTLPVYQESS
ncbi:MAG: GAF domain-containing protein [Anaerolineae bacterium]|nr:GAF domain-containing protein [Anaerolineae bacterium]